MDAGRELDALIAEKVMGEKRPDNLTWAEHWTGRASLGGNWCATTSGYTEGDVEEWVPRPYSTEIGAAWSVVEKLRERLPGLMLSVTMGAASDTEWECEINGIPKSAYHEGWRPVVQYAPTAPHAICLAALKAVAFIPRDTPVSASSDS